VDMKRVLVKVLASKGCRDWLDSSRFTPFAIIWMGAIELIILCAFVYKVGYFDAQIRETLLYK